jgi:hypothetical protein
LAGGGKGDFLTVSLGSVVRENRKIKAAASRRLVNGLYGAILILVIVVAALTGLITVFAHAPGVENARVFVKAL